MVKKTRLSVIQEILDSMPWVMRERMKEKVMKALRERPALDQAGVERLYYKALGYSEDEIRRRMEMPKTIEVKSHPEFFNRLGKKKLEIRKNDRDYQVGDLLVQREWDPNPGNIGFYTGRRCAAYITDVLPLAEVPGITDPGFEDDPVGQFVALSLDFRDQQLGPMEIVSLAGRFGLSFPPNVAKMAQIMTAALESHASKGSHLELGLTGGQCLTQLRQQVHELDQAMVDLAHGKNGATTGGVLVKAANVSNYAMFCAQVSGAIKIVDDKIKPPILALAEGVFEQAIHAKNLVTGEIEPGDIDDFTPGEQIEIAEIDDKGQLVGRRAIMRIESVEPYPQEGPEKGTKGKVVFLEPVED